MEVEQGRKAAGRRPPRQNERIVLSCLRRSGLASKPDIARHISLSPQAVHGIVDGLVGAGLVEQGGVRDGKVGHPSALYAIRPGGAYGVGVEIGRNKVETALIDLTGEVVYRGQAEHRSRNGHEIAETILSATKSVLDHASRSGIEEDRITGAGIVAALGIEDELALMAPLEMLISVFRNAAITCQVLVDRHAVAETLLLASAPDTPLPANFIVVTVGATVDGCVVLDGTVKTGQLSRGSHFRQLPVSATTTLGDIVGFNILADRLGAERTLDHSTEEFFRATQDNPHVLERWLEETADALHMAIGAAHALHDLQQVYLKIAPPVSVGSVIAERIKARLGYGSVASRMPLVEVLPQTHLSPAVPAANLPLVKLFSGASETEAQDRHLII